MLQVAATQGTGSEGASAAGSTSQSINPQDEAVLALSAGLAATDFSVLRMPSAIQASNSNHLQMRRVTKARHCQ